MKKLIHATLLTIFIMLSFASIAHAENNESDIEISAIVKEFSYSKNRLMPYADFAEENNQYEIFPDNHRYQLMFATILYIAGLISAAFIMRITS